MLWKKRMVPWLKDGIILTAEVDKVVVLEYMLRMRKYSPKSIIFIDDQLKNLESLEKFCNKLKIKFHGGSIYCSISNASACHR